MCISLIWGKWGIWEGFRVGVAMAVLLLGPVPGLYDHCITIMYMGMYMDMDMDMYMDMDNVYVFIWY